MEQNSPIGDYTTIVVVVKKGEFPQSLNHEEVPDPKLAREKQTVETMVDKWSGLFSQNRNSINGIPLSFFPPVVVNKKLAVQLEKDEIEHQTKEWRNALILYSMGETPSYNYMQNYIA